MDGSGAFREWAEMTRDRAKRQMATLPLRLNGTPFEGRPAESLLVTRVDARPGGAGDWKLYITLCRPPARGGQKHIHPTAFFPVPAPDLVYAFPEEAGPDAPGAALLESATVGL